MIIVIDRPTFVKVEKGTVEVDEAEARRLMALGFKPKQKPKKQK